MDEKPKRLATTMAMTECVTMQVEDHLILQVLKDETAFFSNVCLSRIFWRGTRIEEDLVDQPFQLDRETACPGALRTDGQFWQGRSAGRSSQDQPGDAR